MERSLLKLIDMKMKPAIISSDDLKKEVMKAYKAGKPMQEFFQKALGK